MFSYSPLVALLHERKMTKTDLQKMIKASSATFAKITKDEYVSMEVLDKICNALNCKISDIIVHIPDNKLNQQ